MREKVTAYRQKKVTEKLQRKRTIADRKRSVIKGGKNLGEKLRSPRKQTLILPDPVIKGNPLSGKKKKKKKNQRVLDGIKKK